jgi:hypothetical protein
VAAQAMEITEPNDVATVRSNEREPCPSVGTGIDDGPVGRSTRAAHLDCHALEGRVTREGDRELQRDLLICCAH